jgi:hypothetical protein
MDHSPPPQPPDLTLQLPRDIYYQIVHTLRRSLPPPLTASADDRARRDNTAIAEVACLLPANAEEVEIAAQFVAANAQAMVCLRLAQEHADDVPRVLQCTAQSARIMREARGARSLLLRVQTARQKREADNDGMRRGYDLPPVSLLNITLSRLSCISLVNPGMLTRPSPRGTPVSASASTSP